jgi:16S rRNA (cytidine1402-2'-O)-methyltransferase
MSKLFLVPTPIGNLRDITLRAIEILGSVDLILAEDTRQAKKLLTHFNLNTPLQSHHMFNEHKSVESICLKISGGMTIALVSDAGTPCISDPGIRLVHECVSNDIEVVGFPGANAAIMALSISGLPTDSFVFEGFLPQKKGRQKKLTELAAEERTIVLYESTYRIEKLLNELSEYMPERFVVVQRELTKMFEESWRGIPKDIIEELPKKTIKGEFVVVISPLNWKN